MPGVTLPAVLFSSKHVSVLADGVQDIVNIPEVLGVNPVIAKIFELDISVGESADVIPVHVTAVEFPVAAEAMAEVPITTVPEHIVEVNAGCPGVSEATCTK